MSFSAIDGLLQLIATRPTISGTTTTLGKNAKFDADFIKWDGGIEKTTFDKEGNVTPKNEEEEDIDAAVVAMKNLINDKYVSVLETSNQYGKIIVLKSNSDLPEINDAVKKLNDRPSVLNKRLRKYVMKANKITPPSALITEGMPSMGGGSFEGEFEAIKNIHSLEKQVINMIGGGSQWAPALAPAATSRSNTFRQLLKRLVKDLASNGKSLDAKDQKVLDTAIDSLEDQERSAYAKLEYLKKYSDLVQKHKNTEDKTIKAALGKENIEEFVTKYMHTLKRVERKSSKLWGAMGALITQAGPFIIV